MLKRLIKWGVRKKLVPTAVYGELLTVEALKRGRTAALETDRVKPVPPEHIEAVLGRVNRHVAAMIRIQLLTGARPGELCIMRRGDIDTGGAVWIYKPTKHKNQYRGQSREIYFGPQSPIIENRFLFSHSHVRHLGEGDTRGAKLWERWRARTS